MNIAVTYGNMKADDKVTRQRASDVSDALADQRSRSLPSLEHR